VQASVQRSSGGRCVASAHPARHGRGGAPQGSGRGWWREAGSSAGGAAFIRCAAGRAGLCWRAAAEPRQQAGAALRVTRRDEAVFTAWLSFPLRPHPCGAGHHSSRSSRTHSALDEARPARKICSARSRRRQHRRAAQAQRRAARSTLGSDGAASAPEDISARLSRLALRRLDALATRSSGRAERSSGTWWRRPLCGKVGPSKRATAAAACVCAGRCCGDLFPRARRCGRALFWCRQLVLCALLAAQA
jgi:hypothetical protein